MSWIFNFVNVGLKEVPVQGKGLERNLKDNSLLISINDLDNLLDSSKYSKQKSALKAELEIFLGRLSPQKSLYTALKASGAANVRDIGKTL